MYTLCMKNRKLVTEELLSKRTLQANKGSLDDFKQYQKAIETLDKVRFPFGKRVIFKPVGSSTTDTNINFYEHTTG